MEDFLSSLIDPRIKNYVLNHFPYFWILLLLNWSSVQLHASPSCFLPFVIVSNPHTLNGGGKKQTHKNVLCIPQDKACDAVGLQCKRHVKRMCFTLRKSCSRKSSVCVWVCVWIWCCSEHIRMPLFGEKINKCHKHLVIVQRITDEKGL